jgi:hypothetical protein
MWWWFEIVKAKFDEQGDNTILGEEGIALDFSPHQTQPVASSTTIPTIGWLPQVQTSSLSNLIESGPVNTICYQEQKPASCYNRSYKSDYKPTSSILLAKEESHTNSRAHRRSTPG